MPKFIKLYLVLLKKNFIAYRGNNAQEYIAERLLNMSNVLFRIFSFLLKFFINKIMTDIKPRYIWVFKLLSHISATKGGDKNRMNYPIIFLFSLLRNLDSLNRHR